MASAAPAQDAGRAWLDARRSPDERADAALAAMTRDEKLRLIFGFGTPGPDFDRIPDAIVSPTLRTYVKTRAIRGVIGFVPGVPRLGIPDQQQIDASIGVRNPFFPSTALPSSLATAASFDPAVTRAGGAMIAREARAYGFNTLLAGGANLAREPRGGRNFEYTGEDPLLAGRMTGALIAGVQSQHVIATLKHLAINDQETQRNVIDVTISASAMRQSDLMAFEIANEIGRPVAAMCAYNLVNGSWGCENDYLLNDVLKRDWGFKGFVMSDWGAVHSTADAANAGLDQYTGFGPALGDPAPRPFLKAPERYMAAAFARYASLPYFAPRPFEAAIADGSVSSVRLDDMARRILWAMFSAGVVDHPPEPSIPDYAANEAVARMAAEESLVLLKNDGAVLPLGRTRSVAVIGGRADRGVLAGGGSSLVTPRGGWAYRANNAWLTPGYLPSSPLAALRRELPGTRIDFDAGDDPASAGAAAAAADVAVVFVTQESSEAVDTRLALRGNQDAVVAAGATANPRTVVVVESGGAVLMPWLPRVRAVLAAFYPGTRGGEAIARVLAGKVNPSGHLPVTFPASVNQLAHPVLPGTADSRDGPYQVVYGEGAAIGYKWHDARRRRPLFAFGHGLSYTQFATDDLSARIDGGTLTASFVIRNTGRVAGKAVAQLYAAPSDWRGARWEAPKRLVGFVKASLRPGQAKRFTLTVDPRLLATYQPAGSQWSIAAGGYRLLLGQASDDLPESTELSIAPLRWSAAEPVTTARLMATRSR